MTRSWSSSSRWSLGSEAGSEEGREAMGAELLAHLARLGPRQDERAAVERGEERVEAVLEPAVGAAHAREHLLHELLVERDLPRRAELGRRPNVQLDLVEDAEAEGRDRAEA